MWPFGFSEAAAATPATTILFRPVGASELALISESEFSDAIVGLIEVVASYRRE